MIDFRRMKKDDLINEIIKISSENDKWQKSNMELMCEISDLKCRIAELDPNNNTLAGADHLADLRIAKDLFFAYHNSSNTLVGRDYAFQKFDKILEKLIDRRLKYYTMNR